MCAISEVDTGECSPFSQSKEASRQELPWQGTSQDVSYVPVPIASMTSQLQVSWSQLRDTKIFYCKQFRDIHLRKISYLMINSVTSSSSGSAPNPESKWFHLKNQNLTSTNNLPSTTSRRDEDG
ncbi:hypothetical protein COOONC_21787 [Cooperia oncophora]